MIDTTPGYTYTLFCVYAHGKLYSKYLSRQYAENSITRHSRAYNLPMEDFTVVEEQFS